MSLLELKPTVNKGRTNVVNKGLSPSFTSDIREI